MNILRTHEELVQEGPFQQRMQQGQRFWFPWVGLVWFGWNWIGLDCTGLGKAGVDIYLVFHKRGMASDLAGWRCGSQEKNGFHRLSNAKKLGNR